MGHLHDRMEADLRLRGHSARTRDTYLRCVGRFVAYHELSPTQLGEEDIRAFLLHLVVERKLRPATHVTYVAALKFLYTTTLHRPQEVARIPWPCLPETLPDVLSPDEVQRLLSTGRNVRHRALLMLAYGAGLRISEICALQVRDVDSERMLIHVRGAKGGKDRYVMLSRRLLTGLRNYWRVGRPPGPFLFPGREADRPVSARTGAADGAPGRQVLWPRQTRHPPRLTSLLRDASVGRRYRHSHHPAPARPYIDPHHSSLYRRQRAPCWRHAKSTRRPPTRTVIGHDAPGDMASRRASPKADEPALAAAGTQK